MSLLSVKSLNQNEHRILGLMMFSLLAALTLGETNESSRPFLIVHFGLFLLWQPVFKQEESFSLLNLFLLIIFIVVFIVWFNLWISVFWMLLLLSLLTGRIFARGLGRAAYGLAVIILFLHLTLITTPTLFELSGISSTFQSTVNYTLLLLPVILLFAPSESNQVTHVDFIRGFMVVILTLFLCMGSIIVTFVTGQPYLQSLANTIIIAAIFLLALAVLWAPRAGFSGLAQLWEKYLLNIGGPFEQWLSRLSALDANVHVKPEEFLNTSIQYLLVRHWIAGIQWVIGDDARLEGEQTQHSVTFIDNKLRLTLFAHSPIGPALLLHTKLLLSVLTFYYKAKVQEQQLIKQAHLRAIYETGSKLTHDIKNILQSTQTLSEVVTDDNVRIEDAKDMLKKQLPVLTQRLKSTLDKLSAPISSSNNMGSIRNWWHQIQARYSGRDIEFEGDINSDETIPTDVFDSVIENLLENARSKRIIEGDIGITLRIQCTENKLSVSVCDQGSPIHDSIVQKLFREVINSDDGYGIGLYQSSQQAEQMGYRLELSHNEDGKVCFMLKSI